MIYICSVIVLLLAVLVLCVFIYSRKKVSPEQKLMNDLTNTNKKLKKIIKKQEKNKEKTDDYTEQIWQKIRDNDEKLNRMRDDVNNRR